MGGIKGLAISQEINRCRC